MGPAPWTPNPLFLLLGREAASEAGHEPPAHRLRIVARIVARFELVTQRPAARVRGAGSAHAGPRRPRRLARAVGGFRLARVR